MCKNIIIDVEVDSLDIEYAKVCRFGFCSIHDFLKSIIDNPIPFQCVFGVKKFSSITSIKIREVFSLDEFRGV